MELIQGEILMKTQAFFFPLEPAPPDPFITRLTQLLPALWKSNLVRASIPPRFVCQFIRGKARVARPASALPHTHIFYTWDLCWTRLAAVDLQDVSGWAASCSITLPATNLNLNSSFKTRKHTSQCALLYLHTLCYYGVRVEP